MGMITTAVSSRETDFDRALAEYLHARNTLDSLPAETTSGPDELVAMDAMGAAERRLFRQTPQNIADVRALAEITFNDPDSVPGWDLIGAVLNGLRLFDYAPSRVFQPDRWIESYRRFGGGWVANEQGVQLLMPVPAGDALDGLMWELRTRGGEEQVKAIIAAGEPVTSPAVKAIERARWEHVVRRFEIEAARMAANEEEPYRGTIDDPECEKAEALTAQIVEAYDAVAEELLRFPAPDAEALRFKLRLMACDHYGAFNQRHAPDFAKIIAADADRLLMEA